jgi:hypothetical protein
MLCLKRLRLIAIALVLSSFMGIGVLWAQSDRGTITGTVTDPSGALIVGASVTAINTATGVSTKTVTSSAGDYTIPLLRSGKYDVTIEQAGFKKFVRTSIMLEVGQTVRVDATLQLGQVTQTVEVNAQAALLQQDTSNRGTVVSSRDVEELPIVSQAEQRNPGFYMTLAPGVTGRGTAAPTASGSGRQLDTTVNGSPSGSTEFYLDGALIGQGYMIGGDFRLLPFPPDAVGEFNVMTLDPPAEFGQTGLGITSFSIKQGGNKLHGSGYEYVRNNDFDSRGFFAPTTPVNKQNEFGATVGGPIRKDKTFFFGWYHGFRLRQQPSNALDTVPTDAMKGGDLSNVLGAAVGTDALGRPVYSDEIYDPTTQRTVVAGAVDPVTGLTNTSGATALIRDGMGFNPVTGLPTSNANIIPTTRIDPVAAKIFSYFPPMAPNPNKAFGYIDNWLATYSTLSSTNQWGSKIDHSITTNQRIMGEMIWWKNFNPSGSKWPGAISEGANLQTQQDIARFAHDWIFRPNLVNHVVVGFNRYRQDSFPASGLGWPAKLGYSGVPQTGPGTTFLWLDIGGLGNTYGRGSQSFMTTNAWSIDEGLTWTKGKHTIKAGVQYNKLQTNYWADTQGPSSYLTFDGGTTSLPGDLYADSTVAGTRNPGFGAAGFLLGLVSHGQDNLTAAEVADRNVRWGGYVQDDFKAAPRLTFNLGLRYDLIPPTVDAHNNMSWMDPNLVNTQYGIKGAQAFASASRRAPVSTFLHAFGPRIGLAYSLNNKTVVRTAYGILYTEGGSERAMENWGQLGYDASDAVQEDASTGYVGALPAFYLHNGWPSSRFQPPPFINQSYGVGEGPFMWSNTDGHLPYMQNWHVGIQRQLPGQIVLDVSYVGTKGTHLPSRLMNTDVMPTKDLYSYQGLILQNIASPVVQALPVVAAMPVDPTTGVHSPFTGFQTVWGGNATLGQALRPFPQYTMDTYQGLSQMRDIGETVGNSIYNALEIEARKHFSQGLTFLMSYTWSKTLTDAGSIFNEFSGFTEDFYNAKNEKALSINDYPNNFVLAYEYQLPFGPGKKFVNTAGPIGKVIGGWSLAGVQQYQSGAPQMVVTGTNPMTPYVGPNSFLMRPNIVPGVPKKSEAIRNGTWDPNALGAAGAVLNINAWSDPALNPATEWTLGSAPPTDGSARRFPYLNEDFSLIKRTHINERINIEIRADFLNIFNRTLFGFDQGGDQYGSVLQGNQLSSGTSFGHVTTQGNFPREIQFGLKINY